MVSEALRRLALAADGAGELAGADVRSASREHPVCGDVVTLFVRVRDGRFDDVRWLAHGCPATMAAAAAARGAWLGAAPAEAATRLRARLAQLGDLAAAERHAERLLLDALAQALAAGPAAGR
jgi:NifU-like protein involved in Fe-S cluster formation